LLASSVVSPARRAGIDLMRSRSSPLADNSRKRSSMSKNPAIRPAMSALPFEDHGLNQASADSAIVFGGVQLALLSHSLLNSRERKVFQKDFCHHSLGVSPAHFIALLESIRYTRLYTIGFGLRETPPRAGVRFRRKRPRGWKKPATSCAPSWRSRKKAA
jgi:hypothetical protein